MPATERSLELARTAAAAADDKLATTIAGIDVSEQLALTDVFVIVSAATDRQVGAIVDEVEDQLRDKGAKPIRREGERDGRYAARTAPAARACSTPRSDSSVSSCPCQMLSALWLVSP